MLNQVLCRNFFWLQQCLPLEVLKQKPLKRGWRTNSFIVATVLTAWGIETKNVQKNGLSLKVATVLTAWGIETWVFADQRRSNAGCNSAYRLRYWNHPMSQASEGKYGTVATVLTAWGIETLHIWYYNNVPLVCCNSAYRLRYWNPPLAIN